MPNVDKWHAQSLSVRSRERLPWRQAVAVHVPQQPGKQELSHLVRQQRHQQRISPVKQPRTASPKARLALQQGLH